MNKTTYDKGLEKGREEGREEGFQLGLLSMGEARFGPASTDIERRISSIRNLEHLANLSKRILKVESWDELLKSD